MHAGATFNEDSATKNLA